MLRCWVIETNTVIRVRGLESTHQYLARRNGAGMKHRPGTSMARHLLKEYIYEDVVLVSQTARKSPGSKAESLLRREEKDRIRAQRAEEHTHPSCKIALFVDSNADKPSRLWQ